MALTLINILSEKTNSAQLRMRCNFAERFAMMNVLTGGYRLVDGELELTNPAAYPYGLPLVVKDVEVKSVGEVMGSPTIVFLDVSYGPKKAEDEESEGGDPEDLFTVSVVVATEGVTMPKKNYTYEGTSQTLSDEDVEIFKWMPTVELSMRCDKMKKLRVDTMIDLVGKINTSTFKIPNDCSFAAEKVLFMGYSGDQKKTTEGYDFASRDLKFLIRPQSWNQIWCAETSTWREVTPAIYESHSFTELFKG